MSWFDPLGAIKGFSKGVTQTVKNLGLESIVKSIPVLNTVYAGVGVVSDLGTPAVQESVSSAIKSVGPVEAVKVAKKPVPKPNFRQVKSIYEVKQKPNYLYIGLGAVALYLIVKK